MADLNFLEYNVNPDTHVLDDVTIRLKMLGFSQISKSKTGNVSMWSLGHCIILLSNDNTIATGLSGIGMNTADSFDNSIHCPHTGLNKCKFANLNLYTFPIDQFRKNYDEHFLTIPYKSSNTELDYFAGIIINHKNINNMQTFNSVLKMKVVKQTTNFTTSVCQNNRFNVLWDTSKDSNVIPTVIVKTDNLIDVVAIYASSGFTFSPVEESHIDKFYEKFAGDELFKSLAPKSILKGYGINIAGKPKSYVMEKMLKNALPNLNILISQRFNHNGLNEDSINYYNPETPDENTEQNIPTA